MLPRREHSFFGDDSDDSVVDGGHDAIHDDVDESADASESDVSQRSVEPVHEVVSEDLQAEIDFVETASRHELLGGGSEFNGLASTVAFGSDGAHDDHNVWRSTARRMLRTSTRKFGPRSPSRQRRIRACSWGCKRSTAAATLAPRRLSARQGRPRIVGAWRESVSQP